MTRLLFSRIFLAVCCAATLAGCSSEDVNQNGAEVTPLSAGYALARAGELALAAASSAGLEFSPLPASGCGTSLIAPERVLELLMALPDAQRTALATVLDASSGVWTAQLYTGELGTGMCLPVQQMLVLLPSSANATVEKMAAALPAGSSN